MPTSILTLDDRTRCDLNASNGAKWRSVADTVMGGRSSCELRPAIVDGKSCLHLSGEVSLANNGGFVQASLDLAAPDFLDATGYQGIELVVFGNDQTYNVHLRTEDTNVVWQSYRASFFAASHWQNIYLPFEEFSPNRIDKKLDISRLRRLGIFAIGKVMRADICFGQLWLRK